jgi:thiol:disulfide interchange protein DsbD
VSTGPGRARLLLLAAAATLLFLPGRSSGAGFETPIAPLRTQHATVRLLLAAAGAAPGGQVEAGLHFELEPGWHIYWQNDGDSGEPPAIAWTLPAGVSASGLEFPAPRRLPYGPLLDYGYEGEVTLPLRLRVEAGARPAAGQAVARVRWLVCREVCLPGKGEFSFPWRVLPAGAEAPRYDAGYLRQAFAALPAPLPAGSRAGRFSR